MSYEKNTWSNGDVITAEKLNNIEDGIENIEENTNNVFIVTFAPNPPYLPNKTFSELVQAVNDGKAVFATRDASGGGGYAILQYQLVNINPKSDDRSYADFSLCVANSNDSVAVDTIHWVIDGTVTINSKHL